MSACLAIIVKNLACCETHVSAIDIDCETLAKVQICRMFSYLVQEGYSWHSLFLNNPTLILAYVFGGYLENGLKVRFCFVTLPVGSTTGLIIPQQESTMLTNLHMGL